MNAIEKLVVDGLDEKIVALEAEIEQLEINIDELRSIIETLGQDPDQAIAAHREVMARRG